MNDSKAAGPSNTQTPSPSRPLRPERSFAWRFLGLDTAAEILSWRPGRKSRIAFVATAVVSAAVAYDRSQAKCMRDEYERQVQHFAEQSMGVDELPRKIMVYTTRLPDDPTEDRAVTWFKKHVKPILYAAGIEYQIIHGNQPGALSRQLVARFRERRLADLDETAPIPPAGQRGFTRATEEARELTDGATVIVGRPALKEYLWALKRAYLTDLDLDQAQRAVAEGANYDSVFEEDLGQELAEDGLFERLTEDSESSYDLEKSIGHSAGAREAPAQQRVLPAASHLPPQAPLLLIPYDHPTGSMAWWPKKAYNGLFNTRRHARLGGQSAVRLVQNYTRSLDPPRGSLSAENGIYREEVEEARVWINERRKMRRDVAELWRRNATGSRDLDTGLVAELQYDKAFRKWPANIAQARAVYEKELRPRLLKAREEGGAAESSLRSERLEKEARWRRNLEGWRIVRPGSGVVWDPDGMEGALRVFDDQHT